jgi:glycerate-2-kinase
VIAAGKAARAMALAFEDWHPVERTVFGSDAHPLPDQQSVRAGLEALAVAADARETHGDLVVLLSGGASAMLAAPAQGLALDLKRAVTSRLLSAGVPIKDLNVVRKHLSRIKGGRLAMHARCTTFALSDVADDDPASIGSGPTVADPSTRADAMKVLERTGLLGELKAALDSAGETPKPGDPALAASTFVLIGGRRTAMEGAVNAALAANRATILFDEPITGDAAAAGAAFVARALAAAGRIGGRVVVIASGETTVHVRGSGTGGRNQEFALGAAQALRSSPEIRAAIAAVGTDGVDGNSPAAGAIADASTLSRAHDAGLPDARSVLAANDTHPYFASLGDAIVTGPTGTNVGDIFLAMIDG